MAKLNEKDKEIMDLKYSIQKSSLEKGKGDYLDTQNVSTFKSGFCPYFLKNKCQMVHKNMILSMGNDQDPK